MSAPSVIIIPRLEDRSLIDCFSMISKRFPDYPSHANLNFLGGSGTVINPLNFNDDESISLIISKRSTLIENASYTIGGYNISFYRGCNTAPKNAFTDEINLKPSAQCKLTDPEKIELAHIIINELKAFNPDRALGINASTAETQLAAMHESTLTRLEKLAESIISDTNNYRVEVDNRFNDRIRNYENESATYKQKLELDYQQKIISLQQKESDLELLRKSIDDKSNTHARRQLRKDIITEIKNRQSKFSLTDGTNGLRRPIAWAMFALIFMFSSLSIFSISAFNAALSSKDYGIIALATIKQLIYIFGAVGSILFYIRWQNRWFEQHSLAEFQLKQLELDMERASWIVETSLEWNDAKDDKIPSELLESLSRNLFREQSEKIEKLVHPADQLASALMGSASMIRLKAGDSELEIDPKKLQKSNQS